MKRNSIVSKLVATFAVILAISYMIIATILSIWVQHNYLNQRRSNLVEMADFVEHSIGRFRENQLGDADMSSILNYLGEGNDQSEIMVLDERNVVFMVSSKSKADALLKVFPSTNLNNLKDGQPIEVPRFRMPGNTQDEFLYAQPMMENGVYRGSVVVLTPEAEVQNQISSVMIIIWICSLVALVASIFIIYYFAQLILIRPLYELNSVANKMAQGNYATRAVVASQDEIGSLATSFNTMAEAIETNEDKRRDFLSNISHELRSPITSIRGFIAGMLDGVIPKDKENYYLTVVYEEINRLTRLINDLLDLAAMESGRFSMSMVEVDLNEIIRLTLVKFQTRVSDKKLRVTVNLDSNQSYVAADRDRLIQVLTNLIDNAVKHSENGGKIHISTRVKGKKVTTTIYNDGTPISEEDKKKIWERFYKADRSRTKKESTGLGLSIVRNILTQWGEEVWVENRETGVAFVFTLSKT